MILKVIDQKMVNKKLKKILQSYLIYINDTKIWFQYYYMEDGI